MRYSLASSAVKPEIFSSIAVWLCLMVLDLLLFLLHGRVLLGQRFFLLLNGLQSCGPGFLPSAASGFPAAADRLCGTFLPSRNQCGFSGSLPWLPAALPSSCSRRCWIASFTMRRPSSSALEIFLFRYFFAINPREANHSSRPPRQQCLR